MPVRGSDARELGGIVARVERGLAELHQRRGAGEVGEIAEADHRAGRVAAHAADAIERLRGALHLLVGQAARESRSRARAARSRARARPPCARYGARSTTRSRITRQVAQRLDRHLGLDRLPARQHLASVHAHRAGAAHLGAAEPTIRRDRQPRSPRSNRAHRARASICGRAPRTASGRRRCGCTRTVRTSPATRRVLRAGSVSWCSVWPSRRASPAGSGESDGAVTTHTSRLLRRTKSGWKKGRA